MRLFSFVVLVLFAAAVGYFAYTNDRSVTLDLAGRSQDVSIPVLIAAVYALGMFTGWAVIGFLKRSWRRVSEDGRA